jgi:hypothetical protein
MLTKSDLEKIGELFDKRFERRYLPMIQTKMQKMIADANAEQMDLMFKHFPIKEEVPTKDDIREIVHEEVAGVELRLTHCEMVVAQHAYKIDVDPVPNLLCDVKTIKKHLNLK